MPDTHDRWELGSDFEMPGTGLLRGDSQRPPWEDPNEPTIYLESGRQALAIIARVLRSIGRDVLVLPDHYCESMSDPFLEAGWTLVPARVDDSLRIQRSLEVEHQDRTAVLSMPLFGIEESPEWIAALRAWQDDGVVIVSDETHRVLRRGLSFADVRVGSLRKMLPVPDGAFLCGMRSDQPLQPSVVGDVRLQAMTAKEGFLRDGRTGGVDYRRLFLTAEGMTEERLEPASMSKPAHELLELLDYPEIRQRRRSNMRALRRALSGSRAELVNGSSEEPSHAVVRHRDVRSLRAYLIERKVYCPIHWPRPDRRLTGFGEWRSDLMSVPIDQRYGPDDMVRVGELIGSYETDKG